MNKSKKVLLIITAFIIVIGVASCLIYRYYYENYVRVRNVFDQIFYMSGISIPMSTRSSGWFVQDDGSRQSGTTYRSTELGENKVIYISVSDFGENGRGTVGFIMRWTFPDFDESIGFSYVYRVHHGELVKRLPYILVPRPSCHIMNDLHYEPEIIDEFISRHGLAREEIEELHDWFLFEYLLPRWHEALLTETRFSPDNWGEFIFVREEYTQ